MGSSPDLKGKLSEGRLLTSGGIRRMELKESGVVNAVPLEPLIIFMPFHIVPPL